MNVFAELDKNPLKTFQGIKETKCYGRMDIQTDGRPDGQRENSIPAHKHSLGDIKCKLLKTSV